MNKIKSVDGSIDCPNLVELTMADNLIKEFHPMAFSKLTKLKTLDLSINHLTTIPMMH